MNKIEELKSLIVGIEDGWMDGSTDETIEKYYEAKNLLSQYDFIKTIKSDAYKEFEARMLEKLQDNRYLAPTKLSPRVQASLMTEEVLKELESEL